MISTGMFNDFRSFNDIFSHEYVMQLQSFSMVALAITTKRLVALLHLCLLSRIFVFCKIMILSIEKDFHIT